MAAEGAAVLRFRGHRAVPGRGRSAARRPADRAAGPLRRCVPSRAPARAALLDAVLAREEPAELWVFRDNPRARAFYVRNGFHAGRRRLHRRALPDLGDQDGPLTGALEYGVARRPVAPQVSTPRAVRPRPRPRPPGPDHRQTRWPRPASLARVADQHGYRRYWLAEHHNMPAVAATNPPVLIAMVAAATERIRVGSGGVMLPNHAPLVVAEQFALLEAAHPGRIDLGIGRAPGTDPVTSYALRHGAGGVEDDAVERFPEYVDDVISLMSTRGRRASGSGGDVHPLNATPQAESVPEVWLLGSSDYSARLAAERGLPYVFAHHFSGRGTAEALELYRSGYTAVRGAPGAADLPHRQRRRGADAGRGRPAGPAQPGLDGGAAHRRPARRPSCSSSRPRRPASPTPTAASPRRCAAAGWSARPTPSPSRSPPSRRARRRRGDGAPGRRGPGRDPGRSRPGSRGDAGAAGGGIRPARRLTSTCPRAAEDESPAAGSGTYHR